VRAALSDGLRIDLFGIDDAPIQTVFGVRKIQVVVPMEGQTVQGPVSIEVIGGTLRLLSPDGKETVTFYTQDTPQKKISIMLAGISADGQPIAVCTEARIR
jgi:hypothetical protein